MLMLVWLLEKMHPLRIFGVSFSGSGAAFSRLPAVPYNIALLRAIIKKEYLYATVALYNFPCRLLCKCHTIADTSALIPQRLVLIVRYGLTKLAQACLQLALVVNI